VARCPVIEIYGGNHTLRRDTIMKIRGAFGWILILSMLSATCTSAVADEVATALRVVVARDPHGARERLESNLKELRPMLVEAGIPLSASDDRILQVTAKLPDEDAVGKIQGVLDHYVVLSVVLDSEAWFSINAASPDPKTRPLVKGRWRTFLVKVSNDSRVTSPLQVSSPQAVTTSRGDEYSNGRCSPQPHDWAHWLLMRMLAGSSPSALLSGKEVEYFVLQLCSLDSGDRAAQFTFSLGGGQVSQGHYASSVLLFRVEDAETH
jgi:hypothetical protein